MITIIYFIVSELCQFLEQIQCTSVIILCCDIMIFLADIVYMYTVDLAIK